MVCNRSSTKGRQRKVTAREERYNLDFHFMTFLVLLGRAKLLAVTTSTVSCIMVCNRSSTKGRQRKVTAREERYILRVLPNFRKSLRKVQGELDLNVCKSTIRNVIKRSGIIVRQKMVKILEMMPNHKTTRLCPTVYLKSFKPMVTKLPLSFSLF
uniref:Transposable element Tc3 transposase-like DNA-binding HTH domain-containing protein n=1 Tax=Caenorhabditis japonica TaxID=281687 RepID=A0A8R1DUQ4_CAEJA